MGKHGYVLSVTDFLVARVSLKIGLLITLLLAKLR